MRIGRRGRRSLLLVAVVATTGCRWIPARRPDPAFVPRTTTPASGSKATLPPLPVLRPIDDREAFASPAPTPILDAAAAREAAIRKIQAAPEVDPRAVPEVAISLVQVEPSAKVDDEVSQARYEIVTTTSPVEPAPEPVVEPAPLPVEAPVTVETNSSAPEASDAEAEDPWIASLKQLRDLARQRHQDGGPEAETWDSREKVLECLATDDDALLWTPIASAMATPIPETVPVVEPEASPPVSLPVPSPTFAITELKLCKKVHAFGRTEDVPGDSLSPGRQVLLYCELDGPCEEQVDDGFRYCLSARVEIVRVGTTEVLWQADLGDQEDRCQRRRRDFYANYRIQVPADLPDGSYQVRLSLSDRIGHHDAERAVEIRVAR